MTLPSGPIWTASLAMHCTRGVRPPPIRKAFRLVLTTSRLSLSRKSQATKVTTRYSLRSSGTLDSSNSSEYSSCTSRASQRSFNPLYVT